MSEQQKLYTDFAAWWPLISPPEHYAEEAAGYLELLNQTAMRPLQTCLELGAGGGNNAFHMKAALQMTLVDLSDGMLDHSRALNPECEHVVGDMRTLRLGREFDAVFAHDAVSYLLTEDDIAAAARTGFAHCRPGGVAVFIPDDTAEDFSPGIETGGHDGKDGRGLRYLFWSGGLDPDSHQYVSDAAYLLRDPVGSMEVVHDRHHLAAHPRATWLTALGNAGFEAHMVPWEHSEIDGDPMVLFVGIKS